MLTPDDHRTDLSRRDFLSKSTAAGLALVPGFVWLSGCGDRATTASIATADAQSPADYVLHASRMEAAPDGRKRQILSYDGKLPGPVIRAKVGEKLRVKVVNDLDAPTTVHWHGMHQPGTYQMDGVPDVSGPPLAPGEAFTYEFTATPAGTHWYHSHFGTQRSDGLFGPLIIEEETPIAEYDRDEILFINDWFLKPGDEILASLTKSSKMVAMSAAPATAEKPVDTLAPVPPAELSDVPEKKPIPAKGGMESMKGMEGKPDIGDVPFESALINGRGRFGNDTQSPLSTVEVKPGETVRLRLINGSSTYAFRFQIDGHPLTVIATDGAPMQPVEVDNLVINVGERYDVLLQADQKGAAWIRAATLAGNETKAILLYPDAPAALLSPSPVVWGKRMLMPAQMRSRQPVKLAENPREFKFTLGGSMMPYEWNVNGQVYPEADPIELAENESVRFVLENPTAMDHPFHLHGHYFSVLGVPDALNLNDPVQKDTVNVPANSTLVLEWKATNPGRWFFHCHIEWHSATGMARVIEIAKQ